MSSQCIACLLLLLALSLAAGGAFARDSTVSGKSASVTATTTTTSSTNRTTNVIKLTYPKTPSRHSYHSSPGYLRRYRHGQRILSRYDDCYSSDKNDSQNMKCISHVLQSLGIAINNVQSPFDGNFTGFDNMTEVPSDSIPESTTVAVAEAYAIPQAITSDYIEMALYIMLSTLGGTVNIYVARKLFAQYRKRTVIQHTYDLKTAFLLLKLHLTFANLLVLLVVCPWRLGWLVTYSWIGGDLLCRIANYVFMVAVDMPCYMITCIAVDRCRVVYRLSMSQRSNGNIGLIQQNCMRWTKILLFIAYMVALVPSTMQFLIWGTVTPEATIHPDWHQCTTVWHIAYYKGIVNQDEMLKVRYYGLRMIDYQMWHLIMTFWMPFGIIFLCYGYITYVLFMYTCKPYTRIPLPPTSMISHSQLSTDNQMRKCARVLPFYEIYAELRDINNGTATLLVMAEEGSANGKTISINGGSNGQICQEGGKNRGGKIKADRCSSLSHNSNSSPPSRNPFTKSLRSHSQTANTHMRSDQPAWQQQLRSRMFNTSGLVVICYLAFWLPYATIALIAMYEPEVAGFLDDYLYALQSLIHLNTIVSPFLYGFRDD